MLRLSSALLAVLLALAWQPVIGSAAEGAVAPTPKSAPWHDLFDGKTLKGWVARGGKAKYEVIDGAIVGSTVVTQEKGVASFNSFLCTEKNYGNFVLELDFLVDPKLNSGVQIRSECFDHETVASDQKGQPVKNTDGKPIKVDAGRVHGYQVEIDPNPRAWSGGIYDERRRLWLVDLKNNEAGRQSFKQGAWNHFRIEAIGPKIRVWLNNVLTADLTDEVTPRGFIGLQVHRTNQAGLQVKFRQIRLQDLDAPTP